MIKIIHNGLIIDVCKKENYLRFLPNHKRFISVEPTIANAIVGSDNNTIYHLSGTPYNFLNEIKTVEIYSITQEEYDKLHTVVISQNSSENIDFKKEIDNLKNLVNQQSNLIQQLLKKLS